MNDSHNIMQLPKQGKKAVIKLMEMFPICGGDLLDIGSGLGQHADYFEHVGFNVTALDINISKDAVRTPDEIIDFNAYLPRMPLPTEEAFDYIWACHVLEHQENVGDFLTHCLDLLKVDGFLVITVPPFKHNIVGGHLTAWNAGLLLYNLVLAGFDCSQAKALEYDYNISVIVKRPTFKTSEDIFSLPLKFDKGDVEVISPYMPEGCKTQSFNGDIKELNWN